MKFQLMIVAALLAAGLEAQTNAPAGAETNTVPSTGIISLQEMMAVGPSTMKLYSMSMISQGQIKGEVDESYLAGYKACSEDSAVPVRSIAAKQLGQHYVERKAAPNAEAVALLLKLARDESPFVRYNAAYYGLSAIEKKTPEIIAALIDTAAADREKQLQGRIVNSLEVCREETAKILDEKLKGNDPIAYFEIYEELTGKPPKETERFMELPSSMPVLFVFAGGGDNPQKMKDELAAELKSIGLKQPELTEVGSDGNYMLMLKTYLTRDRVAVEAAFADNDKFAMPQIWWLTPELEVQFEEWKNR